MDNNNLVYLDTKIILENSTLNLYQYRKPNSSENFTNFKTGVSHKAYKLGLISGEVHRALNCTTTDIALDEALLNLENMLVKNAYPRKIVKQKIKEIRDRKFSASEQKIKRISESNNPDIKKVTISLPYTSFRCSIIASNIHKILKKYTPNFKLRIAFKTIKLSSVITPTLKPRTELYHTSNLVYNFKCECPSSYVGHTKQYFEKRIYQHKNDAKSHVKNI